VTTPAQGCALAPTLTDPNAQATNPNFGVVGQTIADNIGSQIGNGTARQVQLSLKVIF
jgi:hypothetical protein